MHATARRRAPRRLTEGSGAQGPGDQPCAGTCAGGSAGRGYRKWDLQHRKWDFEHRKWDLQHRKWYLQHRKRDFEHRKRDLQHR